MELYGDWLPVGTGNLKLGTPAPAGAALPVPAFMAGPSVPAVPSRHAPHRSSRRCVSWSCAGLNADSAWAWASPGCTAGILTGRARKAVCVSQPCPPARPHGEKEKPVGPLALASLSQPDPVSDPLSTPASADVTEHSDKCADPQDEVYSRQDGGIIPSRVAVLPDSRALTWGGA